MFGRYAISQAPFAGQSGNFYALTRNENIGLADSYVATSTASLSVTETITVNDTNAQQDVFYFGNVDAVFSTIDIETVNSAFLQSLTEPVTLTDTQTASAAFPVSRTENVTLADSSTQVSAFNQSQTENITLADTFSFTGVLYFGITEAFTSKDTPTITAQYPQSITESINLADTITITAQFKGSVTEALASLDAYQAGVVVLFTINENTSLADSSVANSGFTFHQYEVFNALDTPTITAQFVVAENEAFAINTHLELHGWIKIPDHQNANWQAINDTQTANWTPVDDAQTPNWVNIFDKQ